MLILKNKKFILTVFILMAVFGFAVNGFAAEETTSAGVVKDVGTASYVTASISSWILSSVVNLVDFAREFGDNVLTLTAVTVGWQIVLGFTNLGFVLAIIVIAFATIFRMQSYAIKQTLWKLIVAALLVNFSLVIAGAFISVSNNITDVFVKAITGGSLADALGNAMQPQTFWKGPNADPSLSGLIVGGMKYLIEFIISLLFIAVFNFLMILAMLSLFIMLLVRAIALVFLLVLSPAVWLLWIFPGTQSHWHKWWSEFIRWNFFAPAVFFFIYLAVKTAANIREIGSPAGLKTENMGSALLSSDIFQHAANLFVLLALLFGGIYVANKFSIAGGGMGVKMAQGAGKWAGDFVGRKGMQYGSSLLRRKGTESGAKSIADRVSEWSAKSKLAKYTILPGLMAQGIAKFSTAGGENLVKDAKGAASKRSLNENIAMLGYADAPIRHGILQHLQEKDLLGRVPDVMKYVSGGHKAEAARFGQGAGFNGIEKSLGINVEMKEAFNKKDMEAFSAEGKKFFSKFSEKDWAKPQYNEIYESNPSHGASAELHAARQEVFAASVAEINPGQLAKTMPKIKSTNFKSYENAVNKAVTKMHETDPKKAKEVAESFKKALGRRTLGIEWESTEFAESVEPKEEKKEEKKA